MSAAPADLPPLLATIAELAGEAAALTIARRYGGTRVTIPVRPEGRNWLTEVVGPEVAARLIEQLGGARRIDIPLGPDGYHFLSRRSLERRFDELLADGKSTSAIARTLGVTERTVRNRKRARRSRDQEARANGQGDLFG